MKKYERKIFRATMLALILFTQNACASFPYTVPPFKDRVWDLNPQKPGEVGYGYFDPNKKYKCGFLKLGTCYEFVVEYKDLNDPQVWRDFINNETVLMARPKLGTQK